MGGIKDAINVLHDQIETALIEALPERIYQRIEVDSDGSALIVCNQHGYMIVAEIAFQSGVVYVREQAAWADHNTAMFTGRNAFDCAGRYIAYLLECDE